MELFIGFRTIPLGHFPLEHPLPTILHGHFPPIHLPRTPPLHFPKDICPSNTHRQFPTDIFALDICLLNTPDIPKRSFSPLYICPGLLTYILPKDICPSNTPRQFSTDIFPLDICPRTPPLHFLHWQLPPGNFTWQHVPLRTSPPARTISLRIFALPDIPCLIPWDKCPGSIVRGEEVFGSKCSCGIC